MAQDRGKRERRHPDAVAYPEDLGEEGAAMVRPYGGGHVRYWTEGGEVRDMDVAEDCPPEALPAAVSSEFAPLLPKLALPERPGSSLPPPECGECGKPMRLHRTGSERAWLTRLGRTGAERRHCHCRSCGKGRFPLDRAPGLEDSAFTPGMAGVMAGTVPVTGFGAAGRHVADLAGVKAFSGPPRRRRPAGRRSNGIRLSKISLREHLRSHSWQHI